MDVTLLHLDGCPNWQQADEHLRRALRSLGEDEARVRVRRVGSAEEAEELSFRGSPTVLVDGVDPFADPSAPVSLSCRLFRTPDGLVGAPTVDQLVEVLRRWGGADPGGARRAPGRSAGDDAAGPPPPGPDAPSTERRPSCLSPRASTTSSGAAPGWGCRWPSSTSSSTTRAATWRR